MSDGHAQALVLGQKAVATRMLADMPDGLCYPASVRAVALAGPPLTLLHCVGADLTPAFVTQRYGGRPADTAAEPGAVLHACAELCWPLQYSCCSCCLEHSSYLALPASQAVNDCAKSCCAVRVLICCASRVCAPQHF